jgi:hypothetical protein
MLVVDEDGICRMCGRDPLACILYAVGILRDGNDLKVGALQLLVDCLPAWQIEAAASP